MGENGLIQGFSRFIAAKAARRRYEMEHDRLTLLAQRTSMPVVASHTSALRLLGVELPERYSRRFDADAMHIVVGEHRQRHKLSGVVQHVGDETVFVACSTAASAHFNVVTPELALAQMAMFLDDVELVVLGDCMMRRGAQRLTTKARIKAFLDEHPGFAGRKRLLKLLPLMREGTDSSYETRLRIALACRGLGMGEVNGEIASDGDESWNMDVVYRELMTILEYDGAHHMTDIRQGEWDRRKRGIIRSRGWEVLEVTKQRLADAGERDVLACDVARTFSKTLDGLVTPLPCVPVARLADRRRAPYRAPGMEHACFDRYFVNGWE